MRRHCRVPSRQRFDEVDRIDRLMSHYKADSPLSRVNREAAQHPVTVDPELFDFIAAAMRYNRDSGGAFDITVGPLMKAWGFFRGEGHVPSAPDLAAARGHVGGEHVILDAAAKTIRFTHPGVELDLGGIAKGYAGRSRRGAPRATPCRGGVDQRGRQHHLRARRAAGPRRVGGHAPDPIDPRRTALTVDLVDRALSVAGSSEKSFEAGGVKYSHVMDPRDGRPVQGVLSVAVLANSGTAGDALDDAFFVLGPTQSGPSIETARRNGRLLPPA